MKFWVNKSKLMCPECRSIRLIKCGKRDVGRKTVQQYKCKNCLRLTYKPRGGNG